MAYQDWEKYNSKKSSSGVKKKTTKSQSANSKKTTNTSKKKTTTKPSTTQRKKTSTTKKRTVKRKVANKNKKFVPMSKNTIIMLLIGSLLVGGLYYAGNSIQLDANAIDYNNSEADESTHDKLDEFFSKKESEKNNTYSEKELLDYKKNCYIGNFGDKQYLFCPEEYVYELAKYSINKLNELYKSSGEMPLLDNGECIPDCITPELLTAICFTESSYRVESASGTPLGVNRDCPASDRAEGILQQKPDCVKDADRYSRKFGGEGYSLEDRYNPLKAMEISVITLTRVYRAYLQKGCEIYDHLGAKNSKDDVLLGALIVSYNQGEGAMQYWAKSGKLSMILKDPSSTNSYGANYYRAVMSNLEDVLEEEYSK